MEGNENFCHSCWQSDHPGLPLPPPSEELPAVQPTRHQNKAGPDSRRPRRSDSSSSRPAPNWNLILPVAAVLAGLLLALILIVVTSTKKKRANSRAQLPPTNRSEDPTGQEKTTPPPREKAQPQRRTTTQPAKTKGTARRSIPGRFIGNQNSKKLHLSTCKWGRKTARRNRVLFQDAVEALELDYQWCGVCGPKH